MYAKDFDPVEVVEPHLPEDTKMILTQLGRIVDLYHTEDAKVIFEQLEKLIDIYHALVMGWAQPMFVVRTIPLPIKDWQEK